MNRVIKFRAWDGEAMIKDPIYSIGQYTAREIRPTLASHNIGYSLNELIEKATTDGLILMEFIGLKDKNSVEIYEDDIIRSPEGNYLVRWFDYDEDAYDDVKSSTNYPYRAPAVGFGFQPLSGEWDHKDFKLCYFAERTEIIGNIYEKPELLNEN